MARTTKLELEQLLAARNTELEAARVRIAELEGSVTALRAQSAGYAEALHVQHGDAEVRVLEHTDFVVEAPKAKPVVTKTSRPVVYEFDPRIAGDFRRASRLANENRGIVRRMAV